jgi:predicted O-methyltransferase YrrM
MTTNSVPRAIIPHEFAAVDPADPDYPRILAEYCSHSVLIKDRQILQVYEELVNLAFWVRGFAPRNILEVGTVGSTFLLLSKLSTGKKASVDLRDIRPKIHNFMFGQDWCFFQGDSQTPEMKAAVSSYCNQYDLILIDGDHRYEGVNRDFQNYRDLLSSRGVMLFHDVDPDHVFKTTVGGEVWQFWKDLKEGTKTTLCCGLSSGRIKCMGEPEHFGGIGIWRPN